MHTTRDCGSPPHIPETGHYCTHIPFTAACAWRNQTSRSVEQRDPLWSVSSERGLIHHRPKQYHGTKALHCTQETVTADMTCPSSSRGPDLHAQVIHRVYTWTIIITNNGDSNNGNDDDDGNANRRYDRLRSPALV